MGIPAEQFEQGLAEPVPDYVAAVAETMVVATKSHAATHAPNTTAPTSCSHRARARPGTWTRTRCATTRFASPWKGCSTCAT